MAEGSTEELWALAFSLLRPKTGDLTTRDTLNRLVNERFRGASPVDVNETTSTIRREFWSTDKLETLERKHDCSTPRDGSGPIIVVECRGRKLLVDGNNRVNRWLSEKLPGPHQVILITFQH